VIAKIITANILALVISLGATVTVYAQPADMNNTNITIAELAQNVTGNVTLAPLGNVTITNNATQGGANQNQNQNQTQAFQGLENSTAILNQALNKADQDWNQTIRAGLERSISQALRAMGDVADRVDSATTEQMATLQETSEAITQAIDQLSSD
jgi:hypothetical protein